MAVDPTTPSGYFGDAVSITSTSGAGGASQLNMKVSLIALMQAVDPHVSPMLTLANLYAFAANAASVLVGSDRISTTNYAYPLAPGGTVRYISTSAIENVPIGRIWLYCTANSTIGVEAY